MTRSTRSRAEMRKLSLMSPFELKNEFSTLARDGGVKNAHALLNAGRGNPN